MDSSKNTALKLSRKIDLRGVYKEEYFWRLILPLIHTCFTSSILLCKLIGSFQHIGSFVSFHILLEVD